jgi:hypothetical protein
MLTEYLEIRHDRQHLSQPQLELHVQPDQKRCFFYYYVFIHSIEKREDDRHTFSQSAGEWLVYGPGYAQQLPRA